MLLKIIIIIKLLDMKLLTYFIVFAFGFLIIVSSAIAGDSLLAEDADTLKSSFTVLPAVFYTPETKLGFGVYPNYIFRNSPECKPSNISFLAFYTLNKQFSVSFEPSLYIKDNKYIISGSVSHAKWPDDFYGFGTSSSKDDSEEYTTRTTGGSFGIQREGVRGLYLGAGYEIFHSKFLEKEPNGLLAAGGITGSKTGYMSGFGVSVNWDGRDNIFYPTGGEFIIVEGRFYGKGLGSDYSFERYSLDIRKYYSFSDKQVIAFQAIGDFIDGDAPFGSLPQIGAVIRGYLPALYIEKELIAIQAEYRHLPLWRRFGFTLFVGTGTVANKFSDFGSSRFKFAAGIGFRYLFVESEKVNIRIDYGVGDDSAELYLSVGEAF